MKLPQNSKDVLIPDKIWVGMMLGVGIVVFWLFFWFIPWQERLNDFIWLRLGIALIIFLIPGICLYGLLAGRNSSALNHVTFGFGISHLLLASACTMGRILHVPFDLIKNFMMTLGIVLLLLRLYPVLSRGFSLSVEFTRIKSIASFWTLMLVFVLVLLIMLQREFSDDDLSYLAFLTNVQFSARLSFNDIFFGLSQPVTSRFWLMSAPFAQAFLSDVSRIPGLLILSGYYEPFLAVIAALCWYGLARTLQLSHQAAGISVILQILFLLLLSEYLHPGAPFFNQLSADKATATFILVPVFMQSEVCLLRDSTRKNAVLFLLSGLSLTLMHPIALAYATFIAALLVILNTNWNNLCTRLVPLFIIFVALLPQVILRFAGTRAEENVPYSLDVILNQNGIENMITRWGNTQFYGFNPHILKMMFPYNSMMPWLDSILDWGWLVFMAVALVFAIRKLKRNHLAQYIFSAFLLCALAGIPITGWIIGYFLSAWALERTVWLFPFGLSMVFLFLSLRDSIAFGPRIDNWVQNMQSKTGISNLPLLTVTFVTAAVLLLFMRERELPNLQKFNANSRRFTDITQVGRYLDHQIQGQAFVMGSDPLNDLIPGVSAKAKVITFRTSDFFSMSLFPVAEIKQRISDRQEIFSEATPPGAKLALLQKYDIRFIVLTRADRDLFANLLAEYSSLMKMDQVERYFVIEVVGK